MSWDCLDKSSVNVCINNRFVNDKASVAANTQNYDLRRFEYKEIYSDTPLFSSMHFGPVVNKQEITFYSN